ncbi:cation-transporting P-type ATPase [Escherichia coli]
MFKEIFTRLIRHLPSRLVHRDPLPGAQQTVNTAVPPSLSAHCLKMAVMPEEELWKTFDTHPEGLNQAEVESAREQHGENKLPAQQPSPWWYIYGLVIATPLYFTHHSRRYFLRHGRFICRGRYRANGRYFYVAELYSGSTFH